MPSKSTYLDKGHPLRLADELGQLVEVRCSFCHRTDRYRPDDLMTLYPPATNVFRVPFRCSRCRRQDYLRVEVHRRDPGDGQITVRRPNGVRRVQLWREEAWP